MDQQKQKVERLRAAASLNNYKEACESQWDLEEKVEDDEINVEDVILRAPIQKNDLVILSDGKCYSKSSILKALDSIKNFRLPLTQQDFRREDFALLNRTGAPTYSEWKASDSAPFDSSFISLIAQEPNWPVLSEKFFKQYSLESAKEFYVNGEMQPQENSLNWIIDFIFDLATALPANVSREKLFDLFLRYPNELTESSLVPVYVHLLTVNFNFDCRFESNFIRMLDRWPMAAFRRVSDTDFLNSSRQIADFINTNYLQCVTYNAVYEKLQKLYTASRRNWSVADEAISLLRVVPLKKSRDNARVEQWFRNPTPENLQDYERLIVSAILVREDWKKWYKLALTQAFQKYNVNEANENADEIYSDLGIHDETFAPLFEVYEVYRQHVPKHNVPAIDRGETAEMIFYPFVYAVFNTAENENCSTREMEKILSYWPILTTLNMQSDVFLDIFPYMIDNLSSIFSRKKCFDKVFIYNYILKLLQRASPSKEAYESATEIVKANL